MSANQFDTLGKIFDLCVQNVRAAMGLARDVLVRFDDLNVALGDPWRRFRVVFWPLKDGCFPVDITVRNNQGVLSYEISGVYGGTYSDVELEKLLQMGQMLLEFKSLLDAELRRHLPA